jgi:hypothetical protein
MADQSPVSVTLKAGEGFAAPMVTVRADSFAELGYLLADFDQQRVEEILAAAGLLVAGYGFQPQESKPAAKPASEGQKKYLRDLLEERGLEETIDVDALSFDEASAKIEELKKQPRGGNNSHGGRPQGQRGGGSRGFQNRGGGGGRGNGGGATQKQIEWLQDLVKEKDTSGIQLPDDPRSLSREDASALIDALKAAPRNGNSPWG